MRNMENDKNDKLTFKKYSNREFFNIRENTKGYIYQWFKVKKTIAS